MWAISLMTNWQPRMPVWLFSGPVSSLVIRERKSDMACGAALWYNVSIKLLFSRGGLTPLERAPNLRLNRRLDTMDSLFPNAPQDKTCTRCGHSKSSKLFPRRNEWCRLCLQRAHDATPPGKKFCVGCKAYLFLPAFRSETISLGRVRLESFCK